MIPSCKTVIQTDESFRETSLHGNPRYPFAFYLEDIWDFDFHRMDWHWHQNLSFLWFRRLRFTVQSESDNLIWRQGYGLFINRSILHRFEADNHAIIPNIVFFPVFLAAEQTDVIRISFTLCKCYNSFSDIFSEVSWQKNILTIWILFLNFKKQLSSSRLLTS